MLWFHRRTFSQELVAGRIPEGAVERPGLDRDRRGAGKRRSLAYTVCGGRRT